MSFKFVEQFPWLVALVSGRIDGSMRFVDQDQERVTGQNRRAFLANRGLSAERLVRAQLVHGNTARTVSANERGQMVMSTDGLVTNEPNILLGITTADCLPIFFVDPDRRAIGLAHAGWRGLAKQIIRHTVEEMISSFKTGPSQLWVGIGPGIGACHYEVGPEVTRQFGDFVGVTESRGQKTFLDLRAVARQQLVSLGIIAEQIETSPECTYCLTNQFFSYRRDHPAELETMLAVIGLQAV